MRDERGFSLVELMIVVLIIGILIAIALPTFLGARERSQDRAAESSLRTQPAGNQITIQAPDLGDPITELLLVAHSESGRYLCLGQLPNTPVFVRGQGDWADVNVTAGCTQGW